MKFFYLFFIFLISLRCSAQINLQDSLVACYSLNGNATDSVNNLNGILSHVYTTSNRFNTPNSAILFTDSGQIELPNSPLLKPLHALSVSLWMKMPPVANMAHIISTSHVITNYAAYGLNIALVGNNYHCELAKYPDGVVSTSGLSAGYWYHVVFTIDDFNLKIYLNGYLDANAPSTANLNYAPLGKVYICKNNPLSIYAFKGIIDNMKFYNKVLNVSEVYHLFATDPSCSSFFVPQSAFVASAVQICTGDSIVFTDQSSNNPTAWSWYVPGATTSNSLSVKPTFFFPLSGKYVATLVSSNNYGAGSTATVEINVYPCTSIYKNKANGSNVIISPNPTCDKTKLQLPADMPARYILRNIIGVTITTCSTESKEHDIDLRDYPKGVYFLEIIVNEHHVTKKIIKE